MKLWNKFNLTPELRTFLQSELFPDNTFVGLEIEVENLPYPFEIPFPNGFWLCEEDGSLRNYGREFKLAAPLFGNDIIIALDQIENYINRYNKRFGEIEVNERTGLHVHIDIRNEEMEDFRKILMLYIVFRDILLKVSGNRENSKYCVPIGIANNSYRKVSDFLSGSDSKTLFNTEKYADFNLKSILQRGSLEIRIHEGTLDFERIINWIRILLYIKFGAKKLDVSIKDFPSFVSETGFDEFINSIFPEEISSIIRYNGYQNDLFKGIRSAQDLIFSIDINEISSGIRNRKSRKKKVIFNKFLEKHSCAE